MADISAYLERISYSGSLTPNAETLHEIHRAHLFAVPFENLDIGWGREIRLDEEMIVHKIVGYRRGGFCYELNGAIALWILFGSKSVWSRSRGEIAFGLSRQASL